MANLRNHTFEQGNLVGKVILFTFLEVLWVCGPGYSESKLKILL